MKNSMMPKDVADRFQFLDGFMNMSQKTGTADDWSPWLSDRAVVLVFRTKDKQMQQEMNLFENGPVVDSPDCIGKLDYSGGQVASFGADFLFGVLKLTSMRQKIMRREPGPSRCA